MKNFWKKEKLDNDNILCMAPMAGITDAAFRQICQKFGADILYSEMASVNALVYAPQKTLELVKFDKELEKNYVVQLFGSEPQHFALAAKLITEKIQPSGIDINLGCPVRKIQKQGAGAVLMKNMSQAKKCIKAVIENTDLPVSIKTRTCVDDVGLLKFLDFVSDLDIKALMIHGRTLKQGFTGAIDTEIIKSAKNYFGGVILANGGIDDYREAQRVLDKSKADGLGLARGAFSRPYLFAEIKNNKKMQFSIEQLKDLIKEHAELVYTLKRKKGIIELRKNICAYVQGQKNARKIREKVIQINSLKDVYKILENF